MEVASGGTLFLDEVGELPLPLQAKLLTFLDSGRFRRVGSSSEESSTARVVAATNRNLELEIREGRFREDLWFRLSVFAIHVPSLRDRPEDVLPLAEQILNELGQELGRKGFRFGEQARARLQNYPFPGNVARAAQRARAGAGARTRTRADPQPPPDDARAGGRLGACGELRGDR